MKKYFFTFTLVLFLTLSVSAQFVTQWANDIGTISNEEPTKVCSDNSGNSYIAGTYYTTLIICYDTLPTVINPPSGSQTENLFISKFDSAGNCIWTKAGINIVLLPSCGCSTPSITDIDYFDGAIYCVGHFVNKMIFDNDTLFRPACTSWCTSAFIMKISTNGTIIWCKCFQGNGQSSADLKMILFGDDIFVSGFYSQELIVDSVHLISPNLFNSGFLLKFGQSGTCFWGKNIGNTSDGRVADIAFDGEKYLYLVGFYADSIAFTTDTLHEIGPIWSRGLFIAKYDLSGNFIWAKGDTSEIDGLFQAPHLCFNKSGFLYLAALFGDTIRFGSSTIIPPSGVYKDVLVKISPTGQFVWSKGTGNRTSSQNFSSSIEDYNSGFILFSGFTNNLILGNDTIQSAGYLDNLLTQFDSNGNIIYNKHFGGYSQEMPADIHCDRNVVYLVGRSMSNYNIDTFNIINMGGGDILMVKLVDSTSIDSTVITGLYQSVNPDKTLLLVHPNPTQGKINLQIPQQFGQTKTLEIFDCIGQLQLIRSNGFSEIDISSLAKGLYFIVLTNGDNERLVSKIIKE